MSRGECSAPVKAFTFVAPETSGGRVALALSGSLKQDAKSFPTWSCLYAAAGETAAGVFAGRQGADILVMTFPVPIPD